MTIFLDKTYVPHLDRHVNESLDDDDNDSDYEGFFCLGLDPSVCACGHIQEYFEPLLYHAILVWEEKDDPILLEVAAAAKRLGQDARIIEYKKELGDALDFYQAYRAGLIV